MSLQKWTPCWRFLTSQAVMSECEVASQTIMDEGLDSQPLAESSPKASRTASPSHFLLVETEVDEDNANGSDSDSLGEEVLSDFQLLVSDARDKSRSMSSLDGWMTPNVSPVGVVSRVKTRPFCFCSRALSGLCHHLHWLLSTNQT